VVEHQALLALELHDGRPVGLHVMYDLRLAGPVIASVGAVVLGGHGDLQFARREVCEV